MGPFNSSITRVWPVFGTLLKNDPTGTTWFPRLLSLAPNPYLGAVGSLLPEVARFERKIPRNMLEGLTEEQLKVFGKLRNAFEADVPPPEKFMTWLLENPGKMKWPTEKDGKESSFGDATQAKRKALLAGDLAVQVEALQDMRHAGVAGSKRKWWAFEGFTSVDCRLETETLLLYVEGKRTEPLSQATAWYPVRNQLVRNLEAAAEEAARIGKDYAVLLCTETHLDLNDSAFEKSLPHFSVKAREELRKHYLGCLTWEKIRKTLCPELNLPNTVAEAVSFYSALR